MAINGVIESPDGSLQYFSKDIEQNKPESHITIKTYYYDEEILENRANNIRIACLLDYFIGGLLGSICFLDPAIFILVYCFVSLYYKPGIKVCIAYLYINSLYYTFILTELVAYRLSLDFKKNIESHNIKLPFPTSNLIIGSLSIHLLLKYFLATYTHLFHNNIKVRPIPVRIFTELN